MNLRSDHIWLLVLSGVVLYLQLHGLKMNNKSQAVKVA